MTKPSSTSTPIRTPGRSNNNYAAPHTPIASAKRPRASMDKSLLSPNGGSKSAIPSTPLIHENVNENDPDHDHDVPQTPVTSSKGSVSITELDRSQMSPMHPPRPLVIKEEEALNENSSNGASDDDSSWVGRQVGTLFSPMLNLLAANKDDADSGAHPSDGEDGHPEDPHVLKPPGDLPLVNDNDHQDHSDEHEQLDSDQDNDEHSEHLNSSNHEREVLVDDDTSSQGSEEDEDEFNPYVFIKSLPAYHLVAPLRPPIALPPKDKNSPPISLVLDLDETLVHCTVEPDNDADLVFPVVFHGVTYPVHVRLRPHLFEFLEKIQGKYEVIIFTASQQVYANELLNIIDPEGKYIKHRMFRDSCLAVEGNFLKDLNVLGRDLAKSVLVDNSPHAFGYQIDNGIPIESWFDDPKDTELLKLERFLRTLHGTDDVRSIVRKTFQTYKYIEEAQDTRGGRGG